MAEGREEDNWNKSKAAYDEVQRAIVRAEQLELYADVPRLLPESAKPQPVERVMEIVEYSRQNSRSTSMADGGAAPKRAPKRKRNDDIGRNAPEGTPKGFQSVGEMLRTQKGKSKVRKRKPDDPTVGTDDDTDRELEAGLFGPSRQKTPTEPEAGPSSTKKGRKRKSDAGEVKTNAKKKTSAKKGVKRKGVVIDPPTLSQRGQDDSDDQELMAGLNGSSKKPAKKRAPKRRRINGILQGVSSDDSEQDPSRVLKWHPRGQTPPRQATPPVDDDSDDLAAPARAHRMSPVHDNDVIDISSHNSRSRSVSPLVKPRISSPPRGDLELSPPRFSRSRSPTRTAPASAHDSPRASPVPDALPKADRRARSPAPVGKQASLSWLLSDDEAVDDDAAPEQHANSTVYDDAGLVDDDFLEINSSPPIPRQSTPSHTRLTHNTAPGMGSPSSPALSVPCASSPAQYVRVPSAQAMPPPRVPFRPLIATPETPGTPDASFPVARGGGARKRVLVDSSPAEASQPRLQRLQRERELEVEVPSSPLVQRAPTRRKRRRPNGAVLRAFVDDEAGHSGNEVSEGSSGDDDPESESDRRFLRAPPESQVPEGYAQTQVYRESMFTQAPSGQGPAFAARPVVRGKFGPIRTPKRVRGRGSSPVTELGSEPDEYDYGSFIVHDEEDIVYDEDSSQLQN
jgi:ATP-dependent DNA helicase MPH1